MARRIYNIFSHSAVASWQTPRQAKQTLLDVPTDRRNVMCGWLPGRKRFLA